MSPPAKPGVYPRNYRAFIRTQAAKEVKLAREQGNSIKGLYEQLIAEPHETLHRQAVDYANTVTFTNPLQEGLARSLSQIVHQHPLLRLIVPFIRTPSNIIRFVHHRTPGLNLLSRQFREELFSKDPSVQKLAVGKMCTGMALWATAIDLVAQGKIQGGIPLGQEKAARNAGVLPYSFVSTLPDGTQKYTQLSRLDPMSMFFCLAADIHAVLSQVGEQDAFDIATAAIVSISRFLNSRGYLAGVSSALKAAEDGDHHGRRFLESYMASLVPNYFRQQRKEQDPVMREAPHPSFTELQNLIDFYKNQLPGYSKDLLPRLNLFAEEVHYPQKLGGGFLKPFAISQESDDPVTGDPVTKEMWRLKMSGNPPDSKVEGIQLSTEQHHDYIKFSANPAKNLSLKGALRTLISSPSYARLSDEVQSEQLETLIGKFRHLGQGLLFQKYPELRMQAQEKKLKKLKLKDPS